MRDPALDLANSLAQEFEGLRLDAYHCPAGFPTQGWGRLLSRVKLAPLDAYPRIDRATADAWLDQDMAKCFRAVAALIKAPLTVGQSAALADFCFNLGSGNLEVSTLRRLINRGDYQGAADELPKWVYEGPNKLPGLVRRRRAERELFLG